MSIIFYHAPGKGGEIENIFKVTGLEDEVEIFLSIESMMERISREIYTVSCVLLQITSEEEIETCLRHKELLDDIRVIIAPDGNPEILSKVYSLFPRYVSLQNPHFTDIREVLRKMFSIAEAKQSAKRNALGK
ncbi:MAG: hypothetical protein ACOC0U_06710 [Desulfovibrionales bacterium]